MMLKALVLTSLLLNVVLCSPEWELWKKKYGKKYAPEEEPERYQLWQATRAMVTAHNERFEQNEVTYSLELNHLSDLTNNERKSMTGHVAQDVVDFPEERLPKFKIPVKDLPPSMNWVEKGAVTSVKQQAFCGCCYTFAAAAAIESQFFLSTGILINFSEQQLLDCSKGMGPNNGCNGGNSLFCFLYTLNEGSTWWFNYPYWSREEDKCHYGKTNATWFPKDVAYSVIGNETLLQRMVVELGPVAVVWKVEEDFYSYSKGIYSNPTCNSKPADHAITVVGYGTENGQDYWLIKNSWYYTWGEGGYAKIARNKGNMCHIASEIGVPMPYKMD